MHGNEPLVIGVILWIATVAALAYRVRLTATRPGPGCLFRRVFFWAAIPWFLCIVPALLFAAVILDPVNPGVLVERFSSSVFDVVLGMYIVGVGILIPVYWITARRSRAISR